MVMICGEEYRIGARYGERSDWPEVWRQYYPHIKPEWLPVPGIRKLDGVTSNGIFVWYYTEDGTRWLDKAECWKAWADPATERT